MHTVWKGSISFGLVNIPIKLHSATDNKDVRLRQLHNKCNTPIRYEKVCTECNVKITNDDIVKGYEYTKDKYVVISDEELESFKGEQTGKNIEILEFVKLSEIDPIYFEKSYYIAAEINGGKAYSLLYSALKKAKKIAVAKITLRQKEHLSVIRVYDDNLVMELIHYPDEIRNTGEIKGFSSKEVTKKELDIAIQLIENLTSKFEPQKYTDEYREKLISFVTGRAQEDKVVTKEHTSTNVVDLMNALQESLKNSNTESKERKTSG